MGIYRGPNIVTDGLVFGYDADERSTRFYPGEPTTNLATSVSPTWNAWGGMTGTSTSYISASGRMGVKLATFTSGGVEWWRDSGGRIGTVSPNTTYTISAKIRFSGGNPHQNLFYIRQYNSSNAQITEGGWYYSANNVSIGDGWYRTYRTFTTTSTTVSLYLHGYEYNAGISIEIEDIQFEQKSHATQFVSGTRSVTQGLIDLKKGLSIDLSNVSFDSTAHPTFDGTDDRILIPNGIAPNFDNGGFTLEFITYRTAAGFQGGTYLGKGNGTSTGWSFRDVSFFIFGPTSGLIASIPFNATQNIWQHHIISYSSVSSPYIKHYLNGNLYNSSTNDNSGALGSTNSADDFYIGYNYAGAVNRYYTGKMPVVRIYNKPLSLSEVQQNYNAYKSRFNI